MEPSEPSPTSDALVTDSTPPVVPSAPTVRECLLLASVAVAYHVGIGVDQSFLEATQAAMRETSGALTSQEASTTIVHHFFASRAIAFVLTLAWALVYALRRGMMAVPKWKDVALMVSVAVGLFVVLDAVRVWPYAWRADAESSARFVYTLIHSPRSVLLLCEWVFTAGIMIPVIEEVVYRRGVVGVLVHVTQSKTVGVVIGALVFTAVHVGTIESQPSFGKMILLGTIYTMFGCTLGTLAVTRRDGLLLAIAIHGGRNFLDLLILIAGVVGLAANHV